MPIPDILEELSYHSYFHNRILFPSVAPERWALIFGDKVWEFEARMQYAQKGAA